MIIVSDKNAINSSETYLGFEIGSTKVNAVLIDKTQEIIAESSHNWDITLKEGLLEYPLDTIWSGIHDCYSILAIKVYLNYGIKLTTIGAIGISAMTGVYVALDRNGELINPPYCLRNHAEDIADEKIAEPFASKANSNQYIKQLYKTIFKREIKTSDISYITTLSGYVHWRLTNEKVIGIGDASVLFPIDNTTREYDKNIINEFHELTADNGHEWNIAAILPDIRISGERAGFLTEEGARLIDSKACLKAGIPLCPPEGSIGAQMVAANSVRKRTGNILVGQSTFATVVLERPLQKAYPETEMITTPSGDPAALVRDGNCFSDIDTWIRLFGEAASLFGAKFDRDVLYSRLLNKALESSNDGRVNLANFISTHLYSACASLKVGIDILMENEHIEIDSMTGHGEFFIEPYIGQRIMAAVLDIPMSVMATLDKEGPWGMAILASYMRDSDSINLSEYLSNNVFSNVGFSTVEPDKSETVGFKRFIDRYNSL